jgi:hypothetical protein
MTEGTVRLRNWCDTNNVDASELARRVREAARRHLLIDAPSATNPRQVGRWLAGESKPKHSSRALIERVTLIPVEAWTREATE